MSTRDGCVFGRRMIRDGRTVHWAACGVVALAGCGTTSGASNQATSPETYYVVAMRAPGYGNMSGQACPQTDFACMAAVAENAGRVPRNLVDGLQSAISKASFVADESLASRKIYGGVVSFNGGDGINGPSCTVSGFVEGGPDTNPREISLPAALAPPFISGADARRDSATRICLSGLGARLNALIK